MVEFTIPKNLDLDELGISNIELKSRNRDIFDIFDDTKKLKIKEGKVFDGNLFISISPDDIIRNKLKPLNFEIYAHVKFPDTRFRNSYKIDLDNGVNITLDRDQIGGKGEISFPIINAEKEVEFKFNDKWTIIVDAEFSETDYNIIWKSFSEDSNYQIYDQLILDVKMNPYRPIVYLNRDIDGFEKVLTENFDYKIAPIKGIIAQLITNYILLASALDDMLILSMKGNESPSKIENLANIDETMEHRLHIYFGSNFAKYPDSDEILNLINKIFSEGDEAELVSRIILGIQQYENLKTAVVNIIKGVA